MGHYKAWASANITTAVEGRVRATASARANGDPERGAADEEYVFHEHSRSTSPDTVLSNPISWTECWLEQSGYYCNHQVFIGRASVGKDQVSAT